MARSGRLLKKGGSPSTISITIIPSDQMSTWREGELVMQGFKEVTEGRHVTTSTTTSGTILELDPRQH